ncbi:diaminopimelate decarboxylase [Lyngbya confervoides]|uniref:Diaminopimelate decarboxylase n=1 Tax=Lyngbya confervoides BDU141951 TaxID=1574623 RepID=A0ABD4T1N5_9CYAN|nr:diaminopimelate decarboxylase [Lyngbya confervoides]MCM1982197.1 diaminopimelate decarboxylase [Lyngbya confervoides BDU141951]
MVSSQDLTVAPFDDLSVDLRSPNQQLLPLTARVNDQDHLEIGGCDVTQLVQQFGSPLYILDEQTVRVACQQYRQAFARHYPGESLVLYASKAWNCLAVCALVADESVGIDVVSGGELYTALAAGMPAQRIYVHGNNKGREELALAIAAGCTIIADNWYELNLLVDLVAQRRHTPLIDPHELPAGVALIQGSPRVMLRLTPGIECHTHEYIRTGHLDSKFGFDPNQMPEVLAFAAAHPEIEWIGVHAHIGSQIFEVAPHRDLTDVLVEWFVKAAQMGLPMQELNVGGGLGIRYTESDDPPSIEDWSKVVCEGIVAACQTWHLDYPKLLCEPGRSLIGPACVTAYTIGSRKVVPDIRTYLAVDGGMSDNPRPITYQSLYSLVLANRMSAPISEVATIAGKHCESGDILVKDAKIPVCEVGDHLVVLSTGAYNYSMSSNYNRIPRPAAVMVREGQANLILRRETYQDLLRQDCVPARLQTH